VWEGFTKGYERMVGNVSLAGGLSPFPYSRKAMKRRGGDSVSCSSLIERTMLDKR
jgi:hypothetical protein